MNASKPKLLISLFTGMSVRNVLLTGLLQELSKNLDIHIILLDIDQALKKLLIKRNISFIAIKSTILTSFFYKLVTILNTIQYYSFYQKHRTKTMFKYVQRDKEKNPIKFFILYISATIIGIFKNPFHFPSYPMSMILPKNIKKRIQHYDQVLLFSTDINFDKAILAFCSKKVPVNIMVHSWDNLPSRGYIPGQINNLLVWNHTMKKEAIELHNIPESRIHIVGCLQFNFYKT
ncbi:MAG: hypothetical protein HRT90_01520, partial [Candidatus Margulisbacteria bacterium]|nr:hypothetical protein [Candidatus Margulisiibacteriota bacterium]